MARYKVEQKEQTRENIIAAAGRCFKKSGYSGIGVDGLAKEAGCTSGAFYGHFESKQSAFAAAIIAGVNQLEVGIKHFQNEYGTEWWIEFAKFYMNQKRTCDLTESCPLQSLTPEIGRSDEAIRGIFETELLKVIQLATEGASPEANQSANEKTWVNLAMLVGGVTLARAVKDEALSNEIGLAIQNAIYKNQK